ncbi:hypothetical protein RB595_000813 [Gaeumannomyces hyphopodioides]
MPSRSRSFRMSSILSGLAILATLSFASLARAQSFTIAGGQIFIPGLVVWNAPQPGTPMGGETLHISIDVTANGRLNLPPYAAESPSKIHNITMFLYSRETGRNFTISNGTATLNNNSFGDLMAQEPGSTVKHINWLWPNCLVGDGQPRDAGSARGVYNISIRQNFRLNGQDHYTIFDLPISVTNRIDFGLDRAPCDELNNPLLDEDRIDARSANSVGVLFAPGDATQVQFIDNSRDKGDGLGPSRGGPVNGLGSAASSTLGWHAGAVWVWGLCAALAVFA